MPYKTPELRRKNYLENKEKQLKQSTEWSRNHRSYCRESYRRWAAKCPEKVKARRKKYYEENKEEERQKRLVYLSNPENSEKVSENRKEYYAANREREIAAVLKWQKDHPESKKAADQKHRTAKTAAGGSFTAAEWKALCKKYEHKCLRCKKRRKLTADHVIPVSKGGTSNIDNIQPLCGPCNSSKNDKTVDYRV